MTSALCDMVVLNRTELRIARWIGESRYANAIRHNMDPGEGPSGKDGDARHHIRGAECEWAASVILNVCYRPDVENLDKTDVGGLFCVRSTVLAHGRLIVKPRDPAFPFALIYKMSPDTFKFLGWQWAETVRSHWPLLTEFGDPAHYAPQRSLRPLAELLALVPRHAEQSSYPLQPQLQEDT